MATENRANVFVNVQDVQLALTGLMEYEEGLDCIPADCLVRAYTKDGENFLFLPEEFLRSPIIGARGQAIYRLAGSELDESKMPTGRWIQITWRNFDMGRGGDLEIMDHHPGRQLATSA